MTKSSTSFQRRKEQKYYRYKSKEKLSKRGANMPDKNWQFELEEYIKQGEPDKAEKSEAWQTAIGLQAVDGLNTSDYLLDTAKEHIEGKITIDEAQKRIHSYYEQRSVRTETENETKEADIVSARIAKLLGEKAFQFSPAEWLSIHRRLFEGVFSHAGQIRQYNITKKEWVLNGDTVIYADWNSIKETLDYDFSTEKQFSYESLSVDAAVKHLAKFASDIWQIHPFSEGNTRATAVFMIKYMKTFGFSVNNDAFEKNSWYFRNALVRANYNNLQKGVHSTTKFLEMFFSNLLLDMHYELKNRYMHIDYVDESASQSAKYETPKCQIGTLKCTLEELAVLDLIKTNPSVKQTELAEQTEKSVRSVKRIIDSLKEKQYIRRVDGKRYGKWEILA
jgi:fido (protein-threonine AMPylation protein)